MKVNMKYRKIAVATTLCFFSATSYAAIIDNGTYTTDTVAGLDWLDLTETTNMSYNQVSAQLGTGGSLAGWRYATESEIIGLLDAFGGDSSYYNSAGWSAQNNGLLDALAPMWGDTLCAQTGCTPGQGIAYFLYDYPYTNGSVALGAVNDNETLIESLTQDLVDLPIAPVSRDYLQESVGSALVRNVSPVPVPAALWLFGSGLLSLIGVARRKTRS